METKTKLQEVQDVLKTKGYTENEVNEIVMQIYQVASNHFALRALAVLHEDDLVAVDASTDDNKASDELKKKFTERTQKNADDEIKNLIEYFAADFLFHLA